MARFKANSPSASVCEKLTVITRRNGLSVEESQALTEELSALIDALEHDLSALVEKEFEALLAVIHGCPPEEETRSLSVACRTILMSVVCSVWVSWLARSTVA